MTLKNIIFAGTPTIAANVLLELIHKKLNIVACYTQPDRPSGRKLTLQSSPVKNVASQYGIPVLQPPTLKDPLTWEQLAAWQPDLMLVFAYGLILPGAILTIPKFGCINVHTSLLPSWRGAAPIQHAILAGDQLTGISIIRMTSSLDAGEILYARSCNISAKETAASLSQKLEPLAIAGILQIIDQLNNHQLNARSQDHDLATYAPKIHKADAKIIWDRSAIELERMIRAFIPEPICFTELHNKTQIIPIRIWQASVIAQSAYNYDELELAGNLAGNLWNNPKSDQTTGLMPNPGKILIANKLGIDVATGDGVLRLEKLQFPGGKILSASDLINAQKYKNLLVNGEFK